MKFKIVTEGFVFGMDLCPAVKELVMQVVAQ
jgi:hypothetical protein